MQKFVFFCIKRMVYPEISDQKYIFHLFNFDWGTFVALK